MARKKLAVKLPALLSTDTYRPTGQQIRFAFAFIQHCISEPGGQPTGRSACVSIGMNPSNYYNWVQDPKFKGWIQSVVLDYLGGAGLAEVHMAVYRAALANSPTDRKLFLERFDPNFKQSIEHSLVAAGAIPPHAVADAVERSRQRHAALVLQAGQKDTNQPPNPPRDGAASSRMDKLNAKGSPTPPESDGDKNETESK